MRKKRLSALILTIAVIVSAGAGALGGNAVANSVPIVKAQEAGMISSGDVSDGNVSNGDESNKVYVNEAVSPEALGIDSRPGGRLEYIQVSEKSKNRASEDIVVVIDPGHGGEDEGCSRAGVEEKNINLEIALKVENGLEELGYQVIMTRSGDEAVELDDRVDMAKTARADAYISIHQNASEEAKVSGIETWYGVEHSADDSKRLAQLIQKYTVSEAESTDRGIIEDDSLRVVRENIAPACLVETGFLSNADERAKLQTEEYQKALAEGIVNAVDLFFHPKTMYLTFDDGPSDENTNKVLDILKEHDIKATFFLVGENVEKHPETARRIAEEGHSIGIHCYRHDYEELYESADSYLEDFEKAREVIYEATGVWSNMFRFPGGSVNSYNKNVYQDIIDEMTGRGYVYYDWNASLEDAVKKSTPEELIDNARSSTLGRRKVIMLGHDVIYNTTLCLDELIEGFPEYCMEPLTEDVEPIIFR